MQDIVNLLVHPEAHNPMNIDCASLYLSDMGAYEREARRQTELYASVGGA